MKLFFQCDPCSTAETHTLFKKLDYLLLIRVTVEFVDVELEVVVEVFLTRCACALATEKITPRVTTIR